MNKVSAGISAMLMLLLVAFACGCNVVANTSTDTSTGSVQFIVKDSGSGAAISNATVSLDGINKNTGTAGECTFEALSAGSKSFVVTMSGYPNYSGAVIIVSGSNTSETVLMVSSSESEIISQLNLMVTAFKNQDISSYMSVYSPLFSWGGETYSGLQAHIVNGWNNYNTMSFSMITSSVSIVGDNATVNVVFSKTENSKSNPESYSSDKLIITYNFVRESGVWHILGYATSPKALMISTPFSTQIRITTYMAISHDVLVTYNIQSVDYITGLSGLSGSMTTVPGGPIYIGTFTRPSPGSHSIDVSATSTSGESFSMTHTFVVP